MESRLETFLAICKHMNYTRAAEELHITQPSVSQQVKYLEEEYQSTLLIHDGRHMHLTDAGKMLLDAATAIKNDETVLKDRIKNSLHPIRRLRLGATRSIGDFALGDLLPEYISTHPDVYVQLSVGNTSTLLEGIKTGQLQCAFIEGYFDHSQFDSISFREENYIAVCSSSHNFQKKPEIISDLLDEQLILRERGSGTRDILEKFLSLKNLKSDDFPRVIQVESMPVILQLVKNNMGISFMYEMVAHDDLESGEIKKIPLSGLPIKHILSIVWERGSRYADEYKELLA